MAGGQLAYGPSFSHNYRRAATYVDKILKGMKPADLPVEQPSRFELIVNLKTARTLGLAISETFLSNSLGNVRVHKSQAVKLRLMSVMRKKRTCLTWAAGL